MAKEIDYEALIAEHSCKVTDGVGEGMGRAHTEEGLRLRAGGLSS